MSGKILGIHHITALAGDAQDNVDFYAGVLGLRLLKKTVNYDDPYTYHFYYGDEQGSPGTLLTFFPVGRDSFPGRPGTGQVSALAWSVPEQALPYWSARLAARAVEVRGPFERFGEKLLAFRDPDGLPLELIGSAAVEGTPGGSGPVPPDYALRGFHSATLSVRERRPTESLLAGRLEFQPLAGEGNRQRYFIPGQGPGRLVDILEQPETPAGVTGVGAVHHIAWRTPDDRSQLELREALGREGYFLSPVIDRNYFHSVYFREPGRIQFEIATDPPGFTVDEPLETLGSELTLPPRLEPQREEIERTLAKVTLPESAKSGVQR